MPGHDEERCDLPEDFALDQRLANQAELVIFEVAQAAMYELGRPGRRPARQVIHFTKENGVSTARRIARDAAAIDTPSDDREVENPIQRTLPRRVAFTSAISLSILIRSQAKAKEKRKRNWWGRFIPILVMAGLGPAIHVFGSSGKEAVDARDKPGHDEVAETRVVRDQARRIGIGSLAGSGGSASSVSRGRFGNASITSMPR